MCLQLILVLQTDRFQAVMGFHFVDSPASDLDGFSNFYLMNVQTFHLIL